jgi:predicted nucleic acid-binding protein
VTTAAHLVDTDWLIDAIVGVPAALAVLGRLSGDGLAVSIVSLGELFEGVHLSPDPAGHLASLKGFLTGYAVLDLTEPIMERFGALRAGLRRQGLLIPDLDLLIAATALEHGLTLLTRNVRHFGRLPGLTLYAPT